MSKILHGPRLTLALARKYAPIFDVPVATMLAIAEIESEHDPNRINMAARAKGGAWGIGQQMADEADYKVKLIKQHYGKSFPQILPVLAKWRGNPKNLLDPDLGGLLMAWQLGRLHRVFGDFPTVAAAYHQGEFAVKNRLSAGRPAVSQRQPQGLEYVNKAEVARDKFRPMLLAFAE